MDARALSSLRRRLLAWYRRAARPLPWRESRDPYRVWISEIMLQQTQVETVKPYFARFLAEFPHVRALAAAPEERVLRLWEGLGYYRRARQLHAAARQIVAEHRGRFPRDAESVRRLPGIGRYTAGAILSIAFDAPEPILEANTHRLYCRLLALRDDPHSAVAQRQLWQFAADLLPTDGAGTFNQALMELGSQVCTPRNPNCDQCPLQPLCPTHAQQLHDVIPLPKRKPQVVAVHEAAVLVRRGRAVLVRACQPGERWAGLWDFPRFALDGGGPNARQIEDHVRQLTGVTVSVGSHFTTLRHGVTRFRITLDGYHADYVSGRVRRGQAKWLTPSQLKSLPLSSTGRRLCKWIVDAHDNHSTAGVTGSA